jgi:hypothetical protein
LTGVRRGRRQQPVRGRQPIGGADSERGRVRSVSGLAYLGIATLVMLASIALLWIKHHFGVRRHAGVLDVHHHTH